MSTYRCGKVSSVRSGCSCGKRYLCWCHNPQQEGFEIELCQHTIVHDNHLSSIITWPNRANSDSIIISVCSRPARRHASPVPFVRPKRKANVLLRIIIIALAIHTFCICHPKQVGKTPHHGQGLSRSGKRTTLFSPHHEITFHRQSFIGYHYR